MTNIYFSHLDSVLLAVSAHVIALHSDLTIAGNKLTVSRSRACILPKQPPSNVTPTCVLAEMFAL